MKLAVKWITDKPEAIEDILVAEARYVPNAQFLSIPFRSELIHSAA